MINIKKYLETDCEIICLEETTSTNDYLKSLAKAGNPEKTVVIAKRQTNGKGRLGRSFYSPEDSGIYMSILLRPSFSPQKSLFITTAAAVATALAIDEISDEKTGIKWVNDIFINDKKVSGILVEGAVNSEGAFDYAVVGIGVNIYNPENDFPKELKDIAGAVFETKGEDEDKKEKLIAKILDFFFEIYDNFETSDFMKTYKQKSIVLGKNIFVIKSDERKKAKAIDIDSNAHLVVEYENGERESLFSGEVSIRL